MRIAWLALLTLVILLPTAAACGGSGSGAVAPLLDMQFPDKKKCKAPDHSDCDPAPEADKPFTIQGTLVWYWDVDNCEAQNPAFAFEDIVVTFPKFPRNPSWMELAVEPAEIHIPFQDQWDFTDNVDPMTQKATVRNAYPITITITRVGEPTAEEMDKLSMKNGVAEMYAKAVSSQSQGFDPGFAFENFRLDASAVVPDDADAEGNEAPAPAFVFLAVALAGLAVALRRR